MCLYEEYNLYNERSLTNCFTVCTHGGTQTYVSLWHVPGQALSIQVSVVQLRTQLLTKLYMHSAIYGALLAYTLSRPIRVHVIVQRQLHISLLYNVLQGRHPRMKLKCLSVPGYGGDKVLVDTFYFYVCAAIPSRRQHCKNVTRSVSRQPCIVPSCNLNVHDVDIGILGQECISLHVGAAAQRHRKDDAYQIGSQGSQTPCMVCFFFSSVYVVYVVLKPKQVFVRPGTAGEFLTHFIVF